MPVDILGLVGCSRRKIKVIALIEVNEASSSGRYSTSLLLSTVPVLPIWLNVALTWSYIPFKGVLSYTIYHILYTILYIYIYIYHIP